MVRKSFFVVITLVLLFSGISSAKGPEWPGWHGANQENLSPDKGLLREWPSNKPSLLWKFTKCGKGFASVTVGEDIIFTSGDVNEDSMITALDLKGNLLWQAANGASSSGRGWFLRFPGSRSTPVYSAGMVYHLNGSGRLAAFDANTGKELWFDDFTAAAFKGRSGEWGYAESVTVYGDNLLCVPGGPDATVVAINKKTGKLVLASESLNEEASYCSGTVVKHNGKNLFLTFSAKNFLIVDADTLKILVKYPYITKYDVHATTPLYKDGSVYITSGYATPDKLLKISDNADSVTEAWTSNKLDDHHGGVLLYDGYIYGSGDQHAGLHCLDWKTGKDMWPGTAAGKGSSTYADGMIYFFDEKGTIKLVEANPKTYIERGSFIIAKEGKALFWNHPVVLNGRLYIRHEDTLYAFDVRAEKEEKKKPTK